MTLRGPAAPHLSRRTPSGWRRSGGDEESNWARLRSAEEEVEVDVRPHVSRPHVRGPRPHSAIERGQRVGGGWTQQMESLQACYFRDPVRGDQAMVPPYFNELTTSMPALNKEPARHHQWWNKDFNSSNGSLSQWGGSSLGSQESLMRASSAERRGSWERAHIMQAPGKEEHTRLSCLTAVKIGWLPIQRRVVVTGGGPPGQSQHSMDHSTSQVKLKQPIAPTLQRAPVSTNGFRHLGGEVERSHTGPSVVGLRTWQQAPYLASPASEQVPEKSTSSTRGSEGGDRLLGWQALKKGWAFNRASPPLCGRSQPTDLFTRNGSDTTGKSPSPINTTSTESFKPHAPAHNATSVEQYKSHPPLRRTVACQPIRPTVPFNREGQGSSQTSHVETSSAVTTVVPQIKTGFSSITITSRKVVTRSSSLPITGSSSDSARPDRARAASPSLPLGGRSTGSNPSLVTMERKATIVKMMEHHSNESESHPYDPDPGHHRAHDTVVRRRKATIIKVTEHRETYRPADGSAGRAAGPPDHYRHSYTEGLYREDSLWRQRALGGPSERASSSPSWRPLGAPQRATSWACDEKPDTSFTSAALSDPESDGHKLHHRSTLNLFVSGPPVIEVPPIPPEVWGAPQLSPKAAGVGEGWDWDRPPHRPLSFGHAEPSQEERDAAQQPAVTRRLSFGRESNIDSDRRSPVGGFVISSRHGTSHQGTHHQTEAEPAQPPLRFQTPPPPLSPSRRPSPSLTLIRSPDPDTQQTPEDIIAANAAAIIANIKLQRQLNPVTTSPQGNTASCARNGEKPHSAQRPDQQRTESAVHLNSPHAVFVPLSPDPNRRPARDVSLQEALEKSRPDFISRSQGRVRELEQKAQARMRERAAVSLEPQSDAILRHKASGRHPRCHTAQSDNLLRARDRAITGKETQLRSQRCHNNLPVPEAKRKKEAEKKRELYLTNRQRVELFKKKLLDQILQRT